MISWDEVEQALFWKKNTALSLFFQTKQENRNDNNTRPWEKNLK